MRDIYFPIFAEVSFSSAAVTRMGMRVFGCAAAEDRIEHHLLCNQVWNFLSAPLPIGLGLGLEKRSLQTMLLGT